MGKRFLISLSCVVIWSCSARHNEGIIINVDKSIQSGNDDIGKFMKIESLIPIKDKNVFLGTCDKVLATDSLCYIMDSNCIHVLGFDGHFRAKIDRRGAGSGEYTQITDFNVDDDGNVIVYDDSSRKVCFYTSQGRFLKHANVMDGTSFCLLEDGGMAFYRNVFSDTVVTVFDRNMCYRQGYVADKPRPNIVIDNGGKVVEHGGEALFHKSS